MKRLVALIAFSLFSSACILVSGPGPAPTSTAAFTATATFTPSPTATPTPKPPIPDFDHIVILIFENKEYGTVIGNPQMPNFNRLANDYTLLTDFFAITHPSLPNYIALISGDTQGITSDCSQCFVNAPSLPDLIEASGRTWKTYQEDMPQPCYPTDTDKYALRHDPFVYFDPIRLDAARCTRSVVPLTDLSLDIAAGTLPNFIFITPNICNSAHDCTLDVTDAWLGNILGQLVPALDRQSPNYLIVLTWDEGQGNHSCCGLPTNAGGRIPVVLLSPLVKNSYQDNTPYTHYSLLKTISKAWNLPYLGHAAEDKNSLILAPFEGY